MKPVYFTLILFLFCSTIKAGILPTDTTAKKDTSKLRTLQMNPEYPGGLTAFFKLIAENLKYPDVARLIGVDGEVKLQFSVDRNGKVTDVVPLSCVGAGCEAEAVKVLYLSPQWKPGIQDGKPVKVQYTVPINFTSRKTLLTMLSLRNSDYGFVFEINGVIYSIDDAEKLLGKTFNPALIEIALPFSDPDKFPMVGKKEVYCLKMKE